MTQWLADNILGVVGLVGGGIAGAIVAWYALRRQTDGLEARVSRIEGEYAAQSDLNAVSSEVKRSLNHHNGHFTKLGEIEKDISAMGQKLESHVREDHTSFERIEALLKESRDDTKAIRAHLMNQGGK